MLIVVQAFSAFFTRAMAKSAGVQAAANVLREEGKTARNATAALQQDTGVDASGTSEGLTKLIRREQPCRGKGGDRASAEQAVGFEVENICSVPPSGVCAGDLPPFAPNNAKQRATYKRFSSIGALGGSAEHRVADIAGGTRGPEDAKGVDGMRNNTTEILSTRSARPVSDPGLFATAGVDESDSMSIPDIDSGDSEAGDQIEQL
jgi:hypothetical protein